MEAATLGLLYHVGPVVGEPGYGRVTGDDNCRLQPGMNTFQGLKEDKINKVSPVLYLNYGPYSLMCHIMTPHFQISANDSDLIYSTYGQDSISRVISASMSFLVTCQDYPYLMADSLLAILTTARHSRNLQELDTSSPEDEHQTRTLDIVKEKKVTEVEPTGCVDFNNQGRLTALKAGTNFGAPVENILL